jgi:hypothetical protein
MAAPSFPGWRLHAYPAQFSGRAATLVEVPVAVAAPTVPESVPEATEELAAVPVPRRRRVPVVLWVFFAVVVLGGVGAAYYVMVVLPAQQAVAPSVPTAPVPTPEPTPVPPLPVQPEPPVVPIPGTDTDSDGLTNVEELLYRTDFRNPDSDGDTFLDGNEVFHRYNPGATDSSTLATADAVSEYADGEGRFSVTFPASWRQTVGVEGNISVQAPSLAVFSLTVLPKEASQTLEAWYAGQTTLPERTGAAMYLTKMGYSALAADDDRAVALDGGDVVYLFRYDLVDGRTVEYLQTFKMVVNSFRELP